MVDLVVDTNVLKHAANPNGQEFAACQAFLARFAECTTKLCVDPGFSLDPSKNRSLIGAEYLKHAPFGSVGNALLTHLGSTARVVELTTSVANNIRKPINQLIRNKRDRTFLRVAAASQEKTLVSHDFEDFQERKRPVIRARVGVQVIQADECCGLL